MTNYFNPITDKEEPQIKIHPAKDKMICLQNPDKTAHESWYEGRHLADIPSPARILMIGRPNSGKGTVAQQFILNANPPYEKIIVFHCARECTSEWDDVVLDKDTDIVDELPPLSYWGEDPNQKKLLIIDDVDLSNLPRDVKKTLDRTLGFTSTHCNLNVIITAQDLLQIRPNIRRLCNFYCLWKVADVDTLSVLARRVGIRRKYFMQIMKKFKNYHSFLCVDMTVGSPAPVRLNLYNIVELPEED